MKNRLLWLVLCVSIDFSHVYGFSFAQGSPRFLMQDGKCVLFKRDPTGQIFSDAADCNDYDSGFQLKHGSNNHYAVSFQGVCLQVINNGLVLLSCGSGSSQWDLTRGGDEYFVINVLDPLCLTRAKTMGAPDTAVGLADCDGRLTQQWEIGPP